MKKTLIVLIVLIIASSLGIFAGRFFLIKKKGVDVKKSAAIQTSSPVKKTPSFAWGVHAPEYSMDGYNPKTVSKEIDLIKELGVNTVRVNLERSVSLKPFSTTYQEFSNDDFVNRLNQIGVDVYLVLDADVVNTSTIDNFNYFDEGFKMGSYAANRYKGKVKYYQIANEVTGSIVKPPDPNFQGELMDGEYDLKYSVKRYNSTLGWLKGMEKGIRQNDPDAKIVISGHWILTDIISKLEKDGVNFDIIGWAWYSPDGLDMTQREVDKNKYVNVLEKLQAFKKPIWIVESNSFRGNYLEGKKSLAEGEADQAEFVSSFTKNLISQGIVKGYFFYSFLDNPANATVGHPEEAHWGMLQVIQNADSSVTLKKKMVFDVYKNIIKTFSN